MNIVKKLSLIALLFALTACTTVERVELGNASYPDTPVDIYLIPMEGIPSSFAESIAKEIQTKHGLRTKATTTMGRNPSMYNAEHKQYVANRIAEEADTIVARIKRADENPFALVLTPNDINSQEFNFRFQFASHFKGQYKGLSVISTARLDPVNFNLARDDKLRDQRLMKLINKAIGQQIYHYPISTDTKSVMYGPIMGLDDLDRMGLTYGSASTGQLSPKVAATATDKMLAVAATLHDRVILTYNFLPRNLDDAGLKAKSKELDAFWESVKARGQRGVEELRQELHRSDLPVFFNYDGARLLLSLSNSREDRSLALTAMSRAELRDIQWNNYFYTIHSFALEGLDTSDAALKILSDEKFQVIVPEHALTLNQEWCLIYLLLPTEESFYLEKVERRLFEERSVTAQKSLLTILGYSVTKRGDEAIQRFADDPTRPEEARSYARQIIEVTENMTDVPGLGWSFSSYDSLKSERQKLLARVSDEALYDLRRLQLKLRKKGAR